MEIIFRACDGTEFSEDYDCAIYELDLKLNKLKGTYLFDENLNPLPITSENFVRAKYMRIDNEADGEILCEIYDEEYFDFYVPHEAGAYYYCGDNYCWENWEERIKEYDWFRKVDEKLRGEHNV